MHIYAYLSFYQPDLSLTTNSNLTYFDQLRTEVNKVLEVARSGKLIGSSLEAKVYLHTSDDTLAARLTEACKSETDADTLPRIFITSQVIWFMGYISLQLLTLGISTSKSRKS